MHDAGIVDDRKAFGSMSPAGYYAALQVYASLVGKRQAYKVGVIEAYLQECVIEVGEVVINGWDFVNLVNALSRGQSSYPQLKDVINALFEYVIAADAGAVQPTARNGSVAEEPELPEVDLDPDDLTPEPEKDPVVADPDSDAFIIKFVTCGCTSRARTWCGGVVWEWSG